mmetsp:Transcript_54721/g.175532  ORF Transcript_54721/g.175532 Transcript_54721/m.175532 type:complete len:193 (+) Transcript_54721:69-647(+)
MGNPVSLEACRPCSRGGMQQCTRGPPPACYRAAQYAFGDSSEPPRSSMDNARLLRGAQDGEPAVVREALDAGANTETRQPMRIMPGGRSKSNKSHAVYGLTPLMHASKGGHLTCVMALLDARAAVNADDEDGATSLHFAATSGDIDVFKALILAGADVNATDVDERGVLDYLPEDVGPRVKKNWEAMLRGEY